MFDANDARKLLRAYREPVELNKILKSIEMMATLGFHQTTFLFSKTKAGLGRAKKIESKLQSLGFEVSTYETPCFKEDSLKGYILEVEWHEKK